MCVCMDVLASSQPACSTKQYALSAGLWNHHDDSGIKNAFGTASEVHNINDKKLGKVCKHTRSLNRSDSASAACWHLKKPYSHLHALLQTPQLQGRLLALRTRSQCRRHSTHPPPAAVQHQTRRSHHSPYLHPPHEAAPLLLRGPQAAPHLALRAPRLRWLPAAHLHEC